MRCTSTSSPARVSSASHDLAEPGVLEHAAGEGDGVEPVRAGERDGERRAAARPIDSWKPAAIAGTGAPRARSATTRGDQRRRIEHACPSSTRDRRPGTYGASRRWHGTGQQPRSSIAAWAS